MIRWSRRLELVGDCTRIAPEIGKLDLCNLGTDLCKEAKERLCDFKACHVR